MGAPLLPPRFLLEDHAANRQDLEQPGGSGRAVEVDGEPASIAMDQLPVDTPPLHGAADLAPQQQVTCTTSLYSAVTHSGASAHL